MNGFSLDVYNGLLLAPNLDAVFDKYLATVTDEGTLLVPPAVSRASRKLLGLDTPLRVERLAPGHRRYLAWHHERFKRVAMEGE